MEVKEMKVWGIHAGSLGEVDSKFLSKSKPCIAIGWNKVGDFKKIPADRESFKGSLIKAYPDTKKGAVPTSAGMLFRFVHEIQIGDIVIYPSKRDKLIHIGKITANYEYNMDFDNHYPNIRSVEWLKHIPRTKFSQGALYEIGSALSFFR